MRRPVNAPYTITTEFGEPDSYARFGRHSGVDYAVPSGRQVFAPISGQLTNIVSPTGGNMVVISDGQFYHRLMHNSSFSRGNGWVNEGDEVAKSGTTGLSTGPHVHWDVNREGSSPTSFNAFVSPADWLNGAFKQVTPQGGEMANRDQANNIYKAILFRDGDPGGLNNYTGKDANFIVSDMLGSGERRELEQRIKAYESFYNTYVNQIADLSSRPTKDQLAQLGDALKAEQAKVVAAEAKLKEEQSKPKEVLVHDKETADTVKKTFGLVQTIFSYFAGQFKSFGKYIKKG